MRDPVAFDRTSICALCASMRIYRVIAVRHNRWAQARDPASSYCGKTGKQARVGRPEAFQPVTRARRDGSESRIGLE